MKRKFNPPGIPHAFFKWYCRSERYEELHGDLEELYCERVKEKGIAMARLHYFWDVVRCCQPYAWKKPKGQTYSHMIMFRNFYFTTIRNLLKHKPYFLINISGLAIGIASFTFISLYVINELSYDRFHSNYQNIYRVSNKNVINGLPNNQAATNEPMAHTLLNTYPEVVKATRLLRSHPLLVGRGNQKIYEEKVIFADSALFKFFDFKLLKGNPKTALVHPRSMILSKSYARKYFGNEDPMGRRITVEEDTIFYTITGVIEDVPANSHLQFDMVGSISTRSYWNDDRWVGEGQHTYVELVKGADVEALEERMKELVYKYMAPEIEYYTGLTMAEWESAGAGNTIAFDLVPIQDIHLRSIFDGELQPTGNISYIYIYILIGMIILFIALFNFVNLATAHSTTRAREVGVRKVIGSTKRTLVYQFIFESVVVSLMATLCATLIVWLLTPSFVNLVGKGLAFSLTSGYIGWLAMAVLALLVGVLAGCYPAFVLSAFKPVEVLKGTLRPNARSGWLRKILVTLQFTASIVIIIVTLVIYYQIHYMLTKNLGFDKDQILVLERPDALNEHLEAFKNELLTSSDIKTVANSQTIPGKEYLIRSYRKKDDAQTFLFKNNQVTFEHQELMGFKLVSGRFFSRAYGADSSGVVINEATAKALGFKDPVGKQLTSAFRPGELLTIIGVMEDYNIGSLHENVGPVTLELAPQNLKGYLCIKMGSSQNIRETIEFVEDAWMRYTDNKPFQCFFFDEDYEYLYQSEFTTGRLLIVFAALSIFIACMGLMGLITYTASVRKKEIGIRKVLGAGLGTLLRLLSGEIARLMLVATLISWPLAYLATDHWLMNFTDRIDINPWIYVGSTLALVTVVSFAISFQTIKAALGNPVDALRQE